MTTRLRYSIALSIAALAAAFALVGAAVPTAPARPAAAFECARPPALRLHRFEDGSAQLRCGHRLLARISSPG